MGVMKTQLGLVIAPFQLLPMVNPLLQKLDISVLVLLAAMIPIVIVLGLSRLARL